MRRCGRIERLFRIAMGGIAPPFVDARSHGSCDAQKDYQDRDGNQPLRRRRNTAFRDRRRFCFFFAAGEVVFAEQMLFVKAEIARDRAHETAVKKSSWKLFPVLIFQGFEKLRRNARRDGNFVQRDFADLALAFQQFAKTSPSHRLLPLPGSVTHDRRVADLGPKPQRGRSRQSPVRVGCGGRLRKPASGPSTAL